MSAAGTFISSVLSVLGVVECSVLCFVFKNAVLSRQSSVSATSDHKQLCKIRSLSQHRTQLRCY